MNTNQSNQKRCDCCGRITTKFWRRYKEMSFCAACYNREFKYQPCAYCGVSMRAHIKEAKPCCIVCSQAKPCIRCGKITDEIGKITQYGNVCASCSVYFRAARACANCGKVTTRLSKKESLGFYEPVCNQCFNMDHASCQACGRYRKLNQADDGKLLCRICLKEGEKPCTQCNQLMPAGHGKICRNCYYKNLLGKRTQTCIEALSNQMYVSLFAEFSAWLENDTGTNKAAITLNKHFPFFYNLNIHYPDGVPDYCELLKRPEVFHLRTNSLPVRFLCATERMIIDFEAKDEEMNRLIIQKYLKQRTGVASLDKLFDQYYQHLASKKHLNKTTFHSIRLSLMPAMKLLSMTALAKKEQLDQTVLNKLLSTTPGQYAAIYGFVMFCKKQGERVEMPSRSSIVKADSRAKLERELIVHIQRGDDIFSNAKFKAVALAYFHGTTYFEAKTIVLDSTLQRVDVHFFSLQFNQRDYFIPICF